MRFDASLKELQKAIKDLEKAGKEAAKKRGKATSTNQMDMFAMPVPSNDIDVDTLKKQLDDAIASVETVLKEAS